ncbi:hypothetical protein ACWC9T_29060 [Kitasatospora sp. NPDC001159]
MSELIATQAFGGIPREILGDARARVAAVAQGAEALVEALRIKLTSTGAGPARTQVNAARQPEHRPELRHRRREDRRADRRGPTARRRRG